MLSTLFYLFSQENDDTDVYNALYGDDADDTIDADCRYSVFMGVCRHLLTLWIMSEHWTESRKFLMRFASFMCT